MTHRSRRSLVGCIALLGLAALAGCQPGTFTPLETATNQSLYEAALKALRAGKNEKASKGFEQLTFQLPARDPLLPVAYYYLGQAHQQLGEYILAAQAFSRIPADFPEDTLAAAATFEAGISYAKLWTRPDLDSDYGSTAISTFQSFLAAYPDSPRSAAAQKEIDQLNEKFAEKNLITARLYAKQRAYDSAIIYYRDIVAKYAQTPAARSALLGLVKAYRAISYRDDANETCATLRAKYPGDRDVMATCGPAPKTATTTTTP